MYGKFSIVPSVTPKFNTELQLMNFIERYTYNPNKTVAFENYMHINYKSYAKSRETSDFSFDTYFAVRLIGFVAALP